MGLKIPIGEEAAYATAGNIGHPGTSAQITAAQTFAASDLDFHIDDQSGSGITVTATVIVPAR